MWVKDFTWNTDCTNIHAHCLAKCIVINHWNFSSLRITCLLTINNSSKFSITVRTKAALQFIPGYKKHGKILWIRHAKKVLHSRDIHTKSHHHTNAFCWKTAKQINCPTKLPQKQDLKNIVKHFFKHQTPSAKTCSSSSRCHCWKWQ